jgi:cytochrome b6-f complex iron-sulfur subunit
MSVAEMLAAARAGGAQKAEAPKPAAPKPAAEKKADAPKPKPAADKEKPAAPVSGGPKNTASILAAARSGAAKPGPISKAELAAKEKAEPVAKAAKPTVPPMPQKPDYAKPKPAAKADGETRRGFLSVMFGSGLAIGYTCLGVVGGLWTLGFARFMFPNILTEPPSKFTVGFPSDFAPGKVEEKFKAQYGVWIVNTEYNGQLQIAAIRTVCTHLGCTPNWLEAEQKFKCPCHGSGFYKDGINFEGPAPRPLERYAISLADDGQLQVDKSKLFFEEMGQWADAQSYYSA